MWAELVGRRMPQLEEHACQEYLDGFHNIGLRQDAIPDLAKVNPAAPHLYWSSLRAWGTPLLAAPVALLNPSVALVRVYFAVLLGVGLVLAYLPWRRVLHPAVAPLAAFLFATTWFVTPLMVSSPSTSMPSPAGRTAIERKAISGCLSAAKKSSLSRWPLRSARRT